MKKDLNRLSAPFFLLTILLIAFNSSNREATGKQPVEATGKGHALSISCESGLPMTAGDEENG